MIYVNFFLMNPTMQMIKMVKKIIIPLLFLIAVITLDACKSSTSSDAAAMASKGMIPIDAITFKTGNGWGYSILVDNKVYIRQAVIPAVEGDAGFSSDEDA